MEVSLPPSSFNVTNHQNASIVIVGAGIAGLTACSALLLAGFSNVTVLEAEPRIGGRANSWEDEADNNVFELGAGWLHYSTSSLFKFCDSHGFVPRSPNPNGTIDDDHDLNYMLVFSENLKPASNAVSAKVKELSNTVIELKNTLSPDDRCAVHGRNDSERLQNESGPVKLIEARRNCTAADFVLQQYEKIKQHGKTNEDLRVERAALDLGVRSLLAVMGASSAELLSLVGHEEETGSGSGGTRLNVPLSVMVNKLRANVPDENIWLNCTVQNITFTDSNSSEQKRPIAVSFIDNNSSKKLIRADHVIFTGSVGVLKAKHASLFSSSPLSVEKQRAIELFGWGNMAKIYFKYPVEENGKTWWQNNLNKWIDNQERKLDPMRPFAMNMIWTNEVEHCLEGNLGRINNETTEKELCNQKWTRQISGVYFIPVLKRIGSRGDSTKFERDLSWCVITLPGSVSNQVDRLGDELVLADFSDFMRKQVGDKDVPNAERLARRRWSLEPNYLGTFTHSSVGSAREFGTSGADVLAQPEWWYSLKKGSVNGAPKLPGLMFAGEATYSGGLGYMHGAYETGLREAKRIADAYAQQINN